MKKLFLIFSLFTFLAVNNNASAVNPARCWDLTNSFVADGQFMFFFPLNRVSAAQFAKFLSQLNRVGPLNQVSYQSQNKVMVVVSAWKNLKTERAQYMARVNKIIRDISKHYRLAVYCNSIHHPTPAFSGSN